MADMKDLAYTSAEKKAQNKAYGVEASDAKTPTYSWGLNIRLEQSELDKLGITELPAVGSEIYLDVCAKVTRVSSSADERNSQSVVELQITKMGIETGEDDDDSDDDESKESSGKKPTSKPDSVSGSTLGKYAGGKRG